MQSNLKLRLSIVLIVLIGAMILIWPTIYYFLAVSGKVSVTPEKLESLRRKSVPLGLDLQGGVDVLLAIDQEKTRQNKLNGIAEELRTRFRQESPPLDATIELSTRTQQIMLTANKPEQLRSVDNVLATFKNIFPGYKTGSIKAEEPIGLTADSQMLAQDLNATVDSALKVIRDRVDKLGVTQPSVARQGENRIRVQIPGEKDPQAVLSNIIKPAHLEFRGVHTASQPGPDDKYYDDSSQYIDLKTGKPLPDKKIPVGWETRIYRDSRTDPKTGESKTEERYILVRQKVEMTGAMLNDSWVTVNQASFESPVQVWLEFKPEGAKRFAEVTTTWRHKPLAVLLDGVVYTAPNVNEVITEGRCYIHGNFSQEEARNLSLILKAGALPAEMQPIQKSIVEATLGADTIRSSVMALVVGSFIVAALMIGYYSMAGVIAVIAVIINVFLILAFMKLASATLTLSGIGGILLTVGMAVDGNVLIYERIREELKAGKSLKASIALGFSRAFDVIFDANLTTLISGLVLLQFGEGSVKGFALALNVGIIATLFTALFCTRALVDFWFNWKKTLPVGHFQWFKDGGYIDFINMRKFSYVFSTILFILSVLVILPIPNFPGINWGVDFQGGLLTEVIVNKPVDTQTVQGPYADWRVQKVAGEQKLLIRAKFVDESRDQISNTQKEVETRLDKIIGKGAYSIAGSDAVGNEVGREFTQKAILAAVLASVGILVYMWFRFEFLFGFAAVVALFHDVIIVFGIYNLLGTYKLAGEVTLDVVSALLVIIGYSVNDTIIIFDRIRENMKLHPGMEQKRLINTSICESLNRTIMTVSTVLLVLLVMLLIGGSGLFDFALVLFIGIIKGTYSSSFVASPILYDIHRWQQKRASAARQQAASTKVVTSLIKEKTR
ncbi:MAG: protein translocase subunit SecD [Candidatus Sumerlaeota bacterium]|nr:protein translocase subunit SecD [Candidatus Sumerlaeota bacterium]